MVIEHVTLPGGNIFEDIGFDREEAANLKIRSRLMVAVKRLIEAERLTQQQAAERLGTTQPRVSDLVRGKIDQFTIDSLVNMLSHSGVPVPLDGRGPNRPTHPGAVVRIKLEELELSVTEAAQRLHVARRTLSELVNEGRGVSPEMALKLGRFFGNGTEPWLSLQMAHERWRVEHDEEALREADRIEPAA
jgi:addiction module HigA family antidote